MSTTHKIDAELESVCKELANGHRSTPEEAREALEQLRLEREELRKKIGTVNIAVDLIRDARNQ